MNYGKDKESSTFYGRVRQDFYMTEPINPSVDGSLSGTAPDKDSLKLWLCELTHFSPQQVEQVMAQREQELLNLTLKQPLK